VQRRIIAVARVQEQMTIGVLAEATGVLAETIRYYEQIGLLPTPKRTANGYRTYASEHVRRLIFIRRSRELGLSIESIRELLSLANDRLRPCARVDRLVREHIHELDHRIAGLDRLRTALHKLADSCRGGRVAECSILGLLQEPEQALAEPEPACPEADCVERLPRKSKAVRKRASS
jgi:Cu(I)-responsive transcriptional regulator